MDYFEETIADRVVLGSRLSVAWVGYKVIYIEPTCNLIQFNVIQFTTAFVASVRV